MNSLKCGALFVLDTFAGHCCITVPVQNPRGKTLGINACVLLWRLELLFFSRGSSFSMLELSEKAMGDFRRTAFRRKARSGGSQEQSEEETGEFSVTANGQGDTRIMNWIGDRQDYSQ